MSIRHFFIAAAAVVFGAGAASAQDLDWKIIQEVQSELRTERQAVVAENLPLSNDEATRFWPVYKAYRAEMDPVGDRLAKLLLAYARNVEQMNDTRAEAFFQEWLSIERARGMVRDKFVPRVREVLPPSKAVRFFQIENKINALIDLSLAAEVPLVPIGTTEPAKKE